jgi:hypothetical protein
MVISIYKCETCNHKLQLGECNCEKCGEPTLMINRDYVLGITFVNVIIFTLLVALF